MKQLKIMASAQSVKAYVASALAMISAVTFAAPDGYTFIEIIGVLGAGLLTFQGTYWTTNAKAEPEYDGALVIDTSEPAKDSYTLEIATPLDEVSTKSAIVLKVNK